MTCRRVGLSPATVVQGSEGCEVEPRVVKFVPLREGAEGGRLRVEMHSFSHRIASAARSQTSAAFRSIVCLFA